jgi:hypothetical protein
VRKGISFGVVMHHKGWAMVRRRLGEREKRDRKKIRDKSEGIKVMKRNESDIRV